jgi:hypothetical protein
MGFWDVLKDVGKGVIDTVKEKQERIMYYKDLYSSYDDEALIRKYKTATGDAKLGAGLVLKERGYGNQSDE